MRQIWQDGGLVSDSAEGRSDSNVSLVRRIGGRDPAAEEALVRRFDRGIRAILRNTTREASSLEDLRQETFRVLLERLRAGGLREPEALPAFVATLARNVAVAHLRRDRRTAPGEPEDVASLADPAPTAVERVSMAEQARLVRQVLEELPTTRDRDVLRRFYLHQESKERLCADHGLTSLQFNRVLHRARERFRELWARATIRTDGTP